MFIIIFIGYSIFSYPLIGDDWPPVCCTGLPVRPLEPVDSGGGAAPGGPGKPAKLAARLFGPFAAAAAAAAAATAARGFGELANELPAPFRKDEGLLMKGCRPLSSINWAAVAAFCGKLAAAEAAAIAAVAEQKFGIAAAAAAER